jgi:hypothetical protein
MTTLLGYSLLAIGAVISISAVLYPLRNYVSKQKFKDNYIQEKSRAVGTSYSMQLPEKVVTAVAVTIGVIFSTVGGFL